LRCTYVDEIHGEHGQVLVEEVDATLVDTLGNLLADLVRASTVNHVQSCPAVLGLGTRRSTDEERVLELALEIILLDVIGHVSRHLPIVTALAIALFD
jgi:hypothetical protein